MFPAEDRPLLGGRFVFPNEICPLLGDWEVFIFRIESVSLQLCE